MTASRWRSAPLKRNWQVLAVTRLSRVAAVGFRPITVVRQFANAQDRLATMELNDEGIIKH